MAKWEKSNRNSSWSLVFLIYESTCDKELLSSKVGPEHAELMELWDVSGSISLACETCYTLPCLRCCSLHGAAWDWFVLVRNSEVLARIKKKKNLLWLIQRYQWKYQRGTCHSQWKITTGMYWPVLYDKRFSKWILQLGTCEGWRDNILGYQKLSINVSVGRKMRKRLRFASLFIGNSQELENDEREFYKECKDALLP